MIGILKFLLNTLLAGLALAFVVVWFRPGLLYSGAYDPPSGYADAVERTVPSVVSIYTRTMVSEPLAAEGGDPLFRYLYRNRRVLRPRAGLGSGVIVSADGLILTTAHVIAGVDDILVALYDGDLVEARVVGTDPGTDLAVLKIERRDLPAATLDTSGNHRTGDIVLAIGNAFGLNHTVTAGIISAVGRGDLNIAAVEDYIQTDAAINSGNSGGALINTRGEVIGINSASMSQAVGAQGIGFAISASLANEVLRQILEYGSVRRGWLGAQVIDPPLTSLPDGVPEGVVQIAQIVRDGPAWQAGLRPGDLLLEMDGEPVGGARRFSLEIAQREPGSSVEFLAMRNGQRFLTSARLIQQPPLER
ncbi:MAG: Do family serine endopeptidase AlgW [Wenzhouxiangellaceae bacterium]